MVNTCVVFGCNFSYSKREKQGKENVSIHRLVYSFKLLFRGMLNVICYNYQQDDSALFVNFRFPTLKDLREAWVKAIRRQNWQPTSASAVCSQHFKSDDFDLTGQTRRLKEGSIPSVFPAYPSYMQKHPTSYICG